MGGRPTQFAKACFQSARFEIIPQVPKGFFVGVRLGEAVKQRRLDVDTRRRLYIVY